MLITFLLIKKPLILIEKIKIDQFHISSILKNKSYLAIWFIFFMNITCGLAIISQEKPIMKFLGFTSIAFISALTATFNTIGRFGYSTLGDYLKDRSTIYKLIFGTSIIACIIGIFGFSVLSIVMLIISLCIINAGYGGGFSNLPALLSDKFGMNHISTIHGLTLSAWAFAGLCGNQLSSHILSWSNSYFLLLTLLTILYSICLIITYAFIKNSKNL